MAKKKPNILIIWGDDIGWFNISAYNHGVMGYRTPNIDRVAKEGALFTDWYGQQSHTAGRAAFITGQSPIRTGLTRIGLPNTDLGLRKEDPTIADLLKPLGYTCGQFGKNHLGDREEFLPTAHGFDEFFGNVYHVADDELLHSGDVTKDASYRRRFGPRSVVRAWANPDGTQKIEDTGPLDKKRMETMDDEVTSNALTFIERQHKDGKPFFCWWNSTKMQIWTQLDKPQGATGLGLYPDGMVAHDRHVGLLLKKLDELGIADDTIVMYSTDSGAEELAWPEGGSTPFRGEKDTNWEGGWRVPCAIRWPGVIKPGTVSNELFSHQDMLPTLLAAAGDPGIVDKLKLGYKAGKQTWKVHVDGYNLLPYWKGDEKENPRKGFVYWSDDGELMALRYGDWKVHFMEHRSVGVDVWSEPLVRLRSPQIVNLRSDPFEEAPQSGSQFYKKWMADRAFVLRPAAAMVSQWLQTLAEFPPRQSPASFTIADVMETLKQHKAALDAQTR